MACDKPAWGRVARETALSQGPLIPLRPFGSIVAFAMAAAVLADRWAWTAHAEWAGDPGIVLRIASIGSWSVGMLNSHNDPNPNGLTILAAALLSLGDLRVASLVLSALQAVAVCWLALGLTRSRTDAFLIAQPLLWFAALRAVSTELWAQWLLITLSTLAVAALLHHLRTPRVWCLVVSWGSACASAALYLPGLVPLSVISLLWVVRLSSLPRDVWRRHLFFGIAPVALVSGALVGLPFLSAVNVFELSPGVGRGMASRIAHAVVEPVLALPSLLRYLQHTFPRALRPSPWGLSPAEISILTGALITSGLVIASASWSRTRRVDLGTTRLCYSAAFLLGVFAATPLLTGYALSRDGRLDQALQTVPILVTLAFAGALSRPHAPRGRPVATLIRLLALTFALSQAEAGLSIREGILSGRSITNTPHLGEVREAVARLARELVPSASPQTLPIEYRQGIEWFDEFLQRHQRWHGVRMTGGEVFDYELAARTGAGNACLSGCPAGGPLYLVEWGERPRTSRIPLWISSNGRIRIERFEATLEARSPLISRGPAVRSPEL